LDDLRARRLLPVDFICRQFGCCPPGADWLLGTGRRRHAILSRVRELTKLDLIGDQRWRWAHVDHIAEYGTLVAERVNSHGLAGRIDTAPLQAVHGQARYQGRQLRRRAA